MKNRLRLAVMLALVTSAAAPRADTVQASSTTMLNARQIWWPTDPRCVGTACATNMITAVPVYEMLDLSATNVQTGFTDNLELTLSTWGGLALGDYRFGQGGGVWQNGANTDSHLSGDINLGYVRAEFLDRAVSLRLGRQLVADGSARMTHLDGAQLQLVLPAGFGLSGYAGAPVQSRFEALGGPLTTGNTEATFTAGGRASWRYPGLLDVGASIAWATDRGDVSRQEIGADFLLTPYSFVAFKGAGWWSVYEGRMGEASLAAVLAPVRHVDVTLDYRHVEPDLFLPRNSILSVFAADKRNDVGGAVHWSALRELAIDADYHVLLEDAGTGHWARAKGTAHPGGADNTVGAEVSYLYNPENAYFMGRLFGAKALAALTATLDLYGYFFQRAVNGQDQALTATASLGYNIARGLRAVVAGTAGTTAYLSSQYELMAKLVYDQTYIVREVR